MERSDMDRSERDVPRRGAPGGAHQITAVPKLLRHLHLNLKFAIAIIQAGAGYLLARKGNQGSIHNDVRAFLADPENLEYAR